MESGNSVTCTNHYDIAVTLNNLAALQHARGQSRSAQRYYRNALAMKERLLGPRHVDVALTLNNLAVLKADLGQNEAAADLYARALDIFG